MSGVVSRSAFGLSLYWWGKKKKKKDGLSDGRMIGDLPFFCFFVFFFLRLSVFWFVVVVLFLLSSVALLTVVDAYYG